ncbi:hypothetical protein BD779DRAFT_1118347 [Infundibulicybe gibba]|nr:hypothetical protein BD779DRAFT_1118347 [Infundibulicybe gibba]
MDQDAQIDRDGTISHLKKAPNDNTVITSFGFDTEELTFGRDPQCSVRLYYRDVSPVSKKESTVINPGEPVMTDSSEGQGRLDCIMTFKMPTKRS